MYIHSKPSRIFAPVAQKCRGRMGRIRSYDDAMGPRRAARRSLVTRFGNQSLVQPAQHLCDDFTGVIHYSKYQFVADYGRSSKLKYCFALSICALTV